ncbi:hypothetical protein QNI16_29330 [Cytophagaceae bacterium YF14B1]|uniref:Uncharacterized protein n=1 Tax=Xanthocytophaga flava TaxID=3048013 RepID=A0AAE3UAF0_9BACT|nr:hypothetical protein [Xanthocytophaga flavus]MDJ1484637.1 hypothetical protein [Xanthocytophaga flavus]
MGYKASIITIQNPPQPVADRIILDTLGYSSFLYAQETILEDCMYPRDKSISIGNFNNCLMICDDFQLTSILENHTSLQSLCDYEKSLASLFGSSEILSIACHSGVSYHMYTLVSNGKRIRFKAVSSDDPLVEYGERLKEEEHVYALSKTIKGKRLFRSRYSDDKKYKMTEDQIMEDFTFGVAARHLGVKISTIQDKELMSNVPFRKYLRR